MSSHGGLFFMSDFDAVAELEKIRELRKIQRRKKCFIANKLDRHAFEILSLRRSGASLIDIQTFLRSQKKKVVHVSTICRWLKKNDSSGTSAAA